MDQTEKRSRITVKVNQEKRDNAMNADLTNVTSAPSVRKSKLSDNPNVDAIARETHTDRARQFITVHDEVALKPYPTPKSPLRDRVTTKMEASEAVWSRITPASVEYYDNVDYDLIRDLLQSNHNVDSAEKRAQTLSQKRDFILKKNIPRHAPLRSPVPKVQ